MIIALILLWINMILYSEKNKLSAYLKAIVAWTMYMFIITEFLSFIKRLDFIGLFISWFALDLFLLVVAIRSKARIKDTVRIMFTENKCGFQKKYLILICIALVSLFFAIKISPCNWDSMTYHLSRVAHWAENKSVGHYSTNIDRQISCPVLTEFVVAQTYILCRKNDIFVNIIQNASFITNALIIYGISRKLKCKSQYSFLASFLYMTMPIAFAESMTTQVDNFATLWLLIFAYFIIDFVDLSKKIQFTKESVNRVIILGSCVSLGYLCKPSASISMLVFAIWLLIICIIRKDKIINLFKLAAIALSVMLPTMGIEIGRNIYTYGKIISSTVGAGVLISTGKPSYLLINLIKNIACNLSNIAGSEGIITSLVYKLSEKLNVEINDISISYSGMEFSVRPARSYGMDIAINPIIVILTLLCIVWIIWSIITKKQKLSEYSTGFSIFSILSYMIFCMLFKWQPWGTRIMAPYLALLCIAVCVQLQNIEKKCKRRDLIYMVIGVIYFCSFIEFGLMLHYHKGIYDISNSADRIEGYFIYRPDEYNNYVFAANYISEHGYKNIGLLCGEDNYEYPLIKMLEDDIDRFEHVVTSGDLLKYEDIDYVPDCIFVTGISIQDTYIYHNTEYKIAYANDEGGKYILVHE